MKHHLSIVLALFVASAMAWVSPLSAKALTAPTAPPPHSAPAVVPNIYVPPSNVNRSSFLAQPVSPAKVQGKEREVSSLRLRKSRTYVYPHGNLRAENITVPYIYNIYSM